MKLHVRTTLGKFFLFMLLASQATLADAQRIVLPALPDINPYRQVTSGGGEKVDAGVARIFSKSVYMANNAVLVPTDSSIMSYRTKTSTQVDTVTVHKYNAGKWYLNNRYVYVYNGADSIAQTTLQVWNSTKKTFANIGRYNYSYNSSNQKTSMLYEVWDMPTGAFINGIQETYTLTGNDVTDIMEQMWMKSTSSWVNDQHMIYTYNSLGNATDYILELWNSTNNSWINKTRIANTYDASGKQVVLSETFSWNATMANWASTKRVANTLNGSGKVLVATSDYYNSATSSWVPNLKETYTYNAAGNYATLLTEIWDATAARYLNSTSTAYSYNSNDQPTIINTRSWVSGAWATGDESGRTRYYYEGEEPAGNEEPTAVGEPLTNNGLNVSISPNPATDMLYISFGKDMPEHLNAAIVDMQGRTRRSIAIPGAASVRQGISVADLPAGYYILSIEGVEMHHQRMIVVTH